MAAYWRSFAAGGVPFAAARPGHTAAAWPLWNSSTDGSTLLLDTEAKGGISRTTGHKANACQLVLDFLAGERHEGVPREVALRPCCRASERGGLTGCDEARTAAGLMLGVQPCLGR